MVSALAGDYEQTRWEAVRTIRNRRSDCPSYEFARQLLEYDHPEHTALVGIDIDATRAVIYHEFDRYAISVSFGPDGLADDGAKISGFGDGPGVDTLVRTMDPYWRRNSAPTTASASSRDGSRSG